MSHNAMRLILFRIKKTDADKLQSEYEKLVTGLQQANEAREDEDMLSSPGELHLRESMLSAQCCQRTCWTKRSQGISERPNIS